EPTPRRAGRVLVVDRAGRGLLLQGFDPANPNSLHWITIGGGTDKNEGTAEAAPRGLGEEVGNNADAGEMKGPARQGPTPFSFDGMRYLQEEDYYILRVGEVPVTLAHLDPIERATITGYRWWSREELAATTEAFFPAELPELLRRASDAS